MNQGDIVLVPFPYTDLTAIKNRPALVISKSHNSEDVILLAISSQKADFDLQIDNGSLAKGQLPFVSYIKIRKVVTLKKSIIRKKVAILKENICAKAVAQFKELF